MATKFPPQDKHSTSYLLKLDFENVLGFATKQTLHLYASGTTNSPAHWTIIMGENGVGKTTLLRIIFFTFLSPKPSHRIAPNNKSTVNISKSVKHQKTQSNGWDLVFAYGAARRINGMPQQEFEASEGHETLFSELVGLPDPSRRLLDWHIARTLKDSAEEERARAKARYEQVVALLVGLLPDVVDVQLKAVGGRPAVMFKTDFGEVTIEQLSAGYRAMAAWVVDLASHMFNAYPESADPLSEPAVVLVDEFDLHLHPRWQREAIGFLTEQFPAVQFIVTAHSPLVAQSAPDANIVVLKKVGAHVEILNHVSLVELDALLGDESPQDDSGAPRTRTR